MFTDDNRQRDFVLLNVPEDLPHILTLATAEEANEEGDDDDASNDCHSNDQGLEVYCLESRSVQTLTL